MTEQEQSEQPKTVREAVDLYARTENRGLNPIGGEVDLHILQWFFDRGFMRGLQNATRHITAGKAYKRIGGVK